MAHLKSNVGWDDVVVLRKPQSGSETKSEKAIREALRKGTSVETSKKYAAGTNKQHSTDKNTLKLDQDTENLKHETVSLDVGKLIAQKRAELGLNQKELAAKICEKPQIIHEFESGKGLPNQQIFTKLERALGVKLRGKDMGKPLVPKTQNNVTQNTSKTAKK